jgi:hypothetical protein
VYRMAVILLDKVPYVDSDRKGMRITAKNQE